MELSIIQRVAQLVNTRKLDTAQNAKKEGVNRAVAPDSVKISELATEIRDVKATVTAVSDKEGERSEHLERLKEAIAKNQYKVSEPILNSIAERIANTLI